MWNEVERKQYRRKIMCERGNKKDKEDDILRKKKCLLYKNV